MRRWGLIFLVLLVVLGGVLGFALLNVNRYLNENRDWIAERAESAIGRRISFGEIGLSLWGGFGARVSDVQVADDPAFSDEPFVRAAAVRVNVAILPALFGRIEVGEIVLEEPTVRVVRDANGMNFETIGAASPGEPEATAPASPEVDGDRKASPGIALLIALVTIRDGEVVYVDRTASPPTSATVQGLEVSATGLGSDDPVEVFFAAAVLGADEPNVRIEGQVGPLTLETVKNIDAVSLDLAVRVGPVVVDSLRSVPGVGDSIPPELSAPDPLTLVARIQGNPSRLGFEVELDATEARIAYGDAFRKGAGAPFSLAVSGTQTAARVDLTKLDFALATLQLVGSGTVNPGSPTAVDLRIDANEAPLAGWEEILPGLEGYELAGTVAVHLSVKGKADGAALPALTGTVGLANVSARQAGSPDEIEGLSATLEFTGKATEFDGAVRIARGSFGNVPFEAFGATLAMADDVASLHKIEMKMLGGSYGGKGQYDLRDAGEPRFDFSQELRDLDVSKMLASQSPSAGERMTGRLSGKLEVAGSGASAEAVQQTLRGDGNVVVTDGVLVGVNLPELVLKSLTGISGLTGLLSDDLRTKYVDLFSASDTAFEKMSASIVIASGHARTDDAIVAARDYTLHGEGSVAFDGALDFKTTLVASEQLTADVIRNVREARYITNDEKRVEIPARIVGLLPDVRVEPDAEFIAKALTRGAIGTGLELLGGGKKKDAAAADPDALAPDSGEQPRRPEDVGAELIEKGLRGLFGD